LRQLGATPVASALAALVFTLRGAVQWWLLWPAMLEAGSWLPLGCIAVIALCGGGGLRAGCLLAFAVAMTLLAGHVQVAGYLLWAWGTLLCAMLIGGRSSRAACIRILTQFGIALVLGAGIAAVQLFPSFELTLGGTREMGVLPVSQVLAMGTGGFRSIVDAISASQFSSGVVALALVPAALLSGRYRAFSLWAAGLGIAAFALASISSEAGVELYRAIPGIGWFRSPRRILFLSNFCVAVLAGLGLDALANRSAERAAAPIAAVMAGLGLGFAAAWGGAYASAALGVGVAAVAAFVWRGPKRLARTACVGLLVMGAIDLYLAGSISGRLPYDARAAAQYHVDADFARRLAAELGPDRAVALPLTRSRDLKLAGSYGLRRLDDFEPLNLKRHSEYFTYFQLGKSRDPEAKRYFAGAVIPERRIPERLLKAEMREMASRRRLLDIAAVRLFVTPDRLAPLHRAAAEQFVSAAGLSQPRRFKNFNVAWNPNAVPRVFVTYRTEPAPDVDTLLARLSDPGFDPLAASYVEGDFALAGRLPAEYEVGIIRDEMTVVEIDAELDEPGLLVLADSYYAGWTATVDGNPAPIYATNHLFRGVPVPAGSHRIRFEYRPVSIWSGAVLSAASALLLVVVTFRVRRDGSASTRPPLAAPQ
jgi:hypothetical protein